MAVIADEFFDVKIGRMGGFGWACKQLARLFTEHPELGVDIVFLSSELRGDSQHKEAIVHNTKLLLKQDSRLTNFLNIRREKFDLMLCVDYNPHNRFFLRALPRTPVIVWSRDPRTKADYERLRSLRSPGEPDKEPDGVAGLVIDCTSYGGVISLSKIVSRPCLVATTCQFLVPKAREVLGLPPQYPVHQLPNIIDVAPSPITKSIRPRFGFLGRLDPVKRPWLFFQLAQKFPQAEFVAMGQPHFQQAQDWTPKDLPPNLKLTGHIDGSEKSEMLSSCWALINTSIHEGLAVSLLEALHCETPLIGSVDPEGIVSRFGKFVGSFGGSGSDSLPAFEAAVADVLENRQTYVDRARAGRDWVAVTHSKLTFLKAFDDLCQMAGVRRQEC